MKKILFISLLVLLSTGCTVTKEGVFPGDLKKNFSGIDLEKCKAKVCPKKLIVVGTVSTPRKIRDHEEMYASYLTAAKKFVGEEEVVVSMQEFTETIDGWTLLQIYNIPLVGAAYAPIFIPEKVTSEINYPSAAETFLFQVTGDLVSAQSNADGVMMLDRLLCAKKDDYIPCKRQYHRGGFDGVTGAQLSKSFKVKKKGKTIDVDTFKTIDE